MATTSDPRVRDVPLCVDLNQSLIAGTLSSEAFVARLKRAPFTLVGAAANGDVVDVESLPYNRELLDRLEQEKAAGNTLVLLAADDERTARAVAVHTGIFDHVIVDRGEADTLVAEIERRFGSPEFHFVGGDRRAQRLSGRASRIDALPAGRPPVDLAAIVRALRVHQWLKNALVFLPVLGAQRFDDTGTVGRALLAFIAFSLVASCVYVVNDLLDLREDRRHITKRNRPFASGRLPLSAAPLLLAVMLSGASLIAIIALPPAFSAVLAGYLLLTFAYSMKFKESALIDVFLLAVLYTLRVIAGAAATGIQPSVWLLGFCMFFFLSLALVKRYAELHQMLTSGQALEGLPGRSYRAVDLPVLVALGVATGCMSVLILAFYVISDEFASHYVHQYPLWLLCPLTLYWIGRAWLVVARDEMLDDPLVWAVKDQNSRWVAVAAILILFFAR